MRSSRHDGSLGGSDPAIAPQSPAVERRERPARSRRPAPTRPQRGSRTRTQATLLPQLLVSAVEERGDHPAVVAAGGATLTYRELDEKSSQLARLLIERGIGPGDVVAVAVPRSAESVLSVWAVAKSGATFLPVDPKYPAERVLHMVSDSGAAVGLTLTAFAADLPGSVRWTALDDPGVAGDIAARPGHPVSYADRIRPLSELHPAWMIYTSGSTGLPKGVSVPHTGIAGLITAEREHYRVTAEARVLHICSPSFDVSMLELLSAFTAGATLVVSPPTIVGGADLAELLAAERVTHTFITPAALGSVDPQGLDDLRVVVVAGESFGPDLVERWAAPGRDFFNGYGPTEATVLAVSSAPLHPGEPIRIGTPIPGVGAYVLDTHLRPVPAGVTGELYLAGAQLALGYHARPGLTADRFVANPFADGGARMYRTGDLVRRDDSGVIEYLGRSDFQVKIRGYRIELTEIDAVLVRHPDVEFATTVGRALPSGETALVSYVVPAAGGADLDTGALVEFAAGFLPDYMLPAAVVPIAEVPLNPVGKLDRAALPAPVFAVREYRAPQTPAQQAVADVFADVLGVERVGLDDSFLDLGGNSLVATRLVARLGAALDTRVPVPLVFEAPTVESLAARLESQAGSGAVALVARDRPERIPLSLAQQRMWFLNRFAPESAVDNIPVAIRLAGRLDVEALRGAVADLVARHESLRTVYPETDGDGYQVVLPVAEVLPDLAPVEVAAEDVPARVLELVGTGFDVTAAVPWRVALLRISDEEHVLVFVVHHISGDGFSMTPLTRDVVASYRARTRDEPNPLPPLSVQYADYALWQREVLGDEDDPESVLSRQLAYWRAQLADLPEELTLPVDRPRPAVASNHGAALRVPIDAELHAALADLARTHNASVFMVVHTALAVLLARLSGTDDIAVGTPVAGRGEAALDDLIGMFVNTLVLRTAVEPGEPFADLLARVRGTDLEAFANADMPFERLVEVLDPPRSQARHPLFQVMLTFQNLPQSALELPDLSISGVEFDTAIAKFDLQVTVAEQLSERGAPGGMTVELAYATDLFDASTMRSLADRFSRILRGVTVDAATPVGALPFLDDAEAERILTEWSTLGSGVRVPAAATLADRFDAVVRRSPDAPAVTFAGRTLSFAELDARANRLARRLVAAGAGPEELVAVALPRSAELIVALLAVLKSGAAYLPTDTTYPAERLRYMLEDARPRCVVTTTTGDGDALPDVGLPRVYIEDDDPHAPSGPLTDAERSAPLHADNRAYVIYTSGSTGRPKGVAVTHRNVLTLFDNAEPLFGFGADDVWTLFHSYAFDFTVWELWGPLLYGGRLVVVDYLTSRSPEQFLELLRAERVTVLNQTPSAFLQLDEADRVASVERPDADPLALRYVVFGGEALDLGKLDGWYGRRPVAPTLVNMYGITETTVHVSFLALDRGAARPGAASRIGRSLPGLRLRVLDRRLQPVPVGVPGEVYVSGDQLSRGYLGRPGLTAARFVADPFGPGRLYRTGDVARWNADGELEYAGRSDAQVQLRGFRIELGEVEAALLRADAVAQAVAVVRDDGLGDRLVGYVVPRAGADVDVARVREQLGAFLTGYMIPDLVVVLDELPLTVNGKLDRRALPVPQATATTAGGRREPATAAERAVAQVFADVLGVERAGADDSFFELGGNSLIATRVIARINESLGTALAIRELFEAPTVAELAARADAHAESAPRPALTAGPRPDRVPLSLAQQRMWVLNQLDPVSASYNIPLAIRLRGRLDTAALTAAVRDVIERHESLRTRYPQDETGPYQHVLDADAVVPAVVPVEVASEQEAFAEVVALAAEGFDVSAQVPVRGRIVSVGADDHVLALVVHHISADGASLAPLARDLMTAYASRLSGGTPAWAPLEVQYADYALWQRRVLGDADDAQSPAGAQLSYWRSRLAGVPELLDLPTDRPRPPQPSLRGGTVAVQVDEQTRQRLDALALAHRASLFMVVHAALAVLLARLSGTHDIVVGTPVAGRGDRRLDDLVGMFVNTLALRTDVDPAATFAELLDRARAVDLEAFGHADVPFERVVDDVVAVRSPARHPVFQTVLSFQNTEAARLELPGLTVEALDAGELAAKFDLQVTVDPREHPGGSAAGEHPGGSAAGMHVGFTYAVDLFDAGTVATFAERFVTVLRAVAETSDAVVGDIDIRTETERTAPTVIEPEPVAVPDRVERTVPQEWQVAVESDPEAPAFVADGVEVTYLDLDRRSSQWARYLIAEGVGPGDGVAVAVPAGPELITALWAVTKAGAAIVPAVSGSATPAETPGLGLTTTGSDARRSAAARWVCLDDPATVAAVDTLSHRPVDYSERVRVLQPQHPALWVAGRVLYHGELVAVVRGGAAALKLDYESRSLVCDLTAEQWRIFAILAAGIAGAVVIVPEPGADLAAVVADEWVTHAFVPSSLVDALNEAPGDDLGVVVVTDRDEVPPGSVAAGGQWTTVAAVDPWSMRN
ncbi:non-ribosomal peptide synthetase [Rhodococcus sp. DMU1]|uniref:non-ribosomal peptide synthetase n=1 Tax=Rhodococcus sp. DMU1 TaxID=2722825 RepID=UPI001FF08794|nr:non-ribosomal peptide synthetase [Rhodococcus sp. DMU1]